MEYLFLAVALLLVMLFAGILWQWIPILAIRPRNPQITLADVVSYEAPKTVLKDSVLELLDPSLPASALTHSILLYGVGGSKKTLVRAAAGYGMEQGKLTFYELDCRRLVCDSEFEIASSKIANTLRAAKKNQPAVVLIAGLEAIVDDHEIMQFFHGAIESFEDDRVLLLGTASLSETAVEHKLDVAFPVRIEIDLPNALDRETIVKSWFETSESRSCYDLSKMALELQGCSYSEIVSTLTYAAFLAKKDGRSVMNETDFVRALYFRNSAFEASAAPSEALRISYHEAGHALCHYALNNGAIMRVSAYPVSGHQAGGFTRPYLPETVTTKMNILGVLAATLAGRAAEEVAYGEENVSDGCFDDLVKARRLAKSFLDHGFGVKLSGVDKSEVDLLLDHAYAMALSFLKDRQQNLEDLAKLLLQSFTLNGDDVANVLADPHAIPSKEELAEIFGDDDDFDLENYMID